MSDDTCEATYPQDAEDRCVLAPDHCGNHYFASEQYAALHADRDEFER